MRNATTTTIAPTGTISILANCSSGVEPLFAVAYVRTVMDNDRLVEIHPIFKKIAEEGQFYSDDLMEKIVESGTLRELADIPEEVQALFATSHDISPDWHVKIQAAFQKYTDNAVSKTVNFPASATEDDVRRVYELAYKLGCKGVTIYRDGSRNQQVLTRGVETPEEPASPSEKITPRPRPDRTYGFTEKIGTGCGNLYITINCDDHGPNEIFTQMGKSGGCAASQSEATGRLVSLALRSGLSINAIVDQLKGIRCPSPRWYKGSMVLSCSDAIGKVLEAYFEENHGTSGQPPKKKALKNATGICPECPDCGSIVEFSEGCVICKACGYTKC
jgi:ribonucleoside-diphosphate reductase alpha chain